MKPLYRNLLNILIACATFGQVVHSEPQVERRQVGNLIYEDVPEPSQELIDRMQQYLNVRRASFQDWGPDGNGVYLSTRFGNTSQLHYVANPLHYREQKTFFEEPIRSVSANPSNGNLLILKDIGGNEAYQIYNFNPKTAKTTLLTDGVNRCGFPKWDKQGNKFLYSSTKRNGTDWDLILRRPDGSERVYPMEGHWSTQDISENGRYALALKYISITDSRLFIVDLFSGGMTAVSNHSDVSVGTAKFGKDENTVYLTTDKAGEFTQLFRWHRSGDSYELQALTADIPWNITSFDISHDYKTIAFAANANGLADIGFYNLQTGGISRPESLPVGELSSGLHFAPKSHKLGFSMTGPKVPGDVFVIDEHHNISQWTRSETGGLSSDNFIDPELIHFESFDGRKIPAFVYEPKKAGPHPVVIYIHGGPESQYTPYFSSTLQYLASELNIAVIAPNVRGSDGYGKTYLKLDNGFKREDSVKDIGALLDWINANPKFRSDKVAVYGGSYGGYMVLASLVHYSDRLAGGIDVVGISNFVTFLNNTKDYRRDLRRVEYGDERDPAMNAHLQAISPTNNVEKIQAPLFVVQGKNDPRVPESEATQIVEKVRENGKKVWYLLALDEGHGFRKKVNRDAYTYAVMMFFEQYLLDQ